MGSYAWINLVVYLAVLGVLAWPLGLWMARIATAGSSPAGRAIGSVERGLYRLAGVDESQSMGWKHYAIGLMLFNLIGVLVVYALQRMQGMLPFNPQALTAVSPD